MKRRYQVFCMMLAISTSIFAFDFSFAGGSLGVLIINNTVPESAPNPVVTPIGGFAGFTLAEQSSSSQGFLFTPSLDILWLNYENREGRAIPTESEQGSGNNVFVIGLLLDLPVGYFFSFGPAVNENLLHRFSAGIFTGTSFLLRICFNGDTTEAYAEQMEENRKAVAQYLWDKGRWFYPMLGARFSVILQESFTFNISAKWYIPVFNLWTDTKPFLDASMLAIQLAMQVSL